VLGELGGLPDWPGMAPLEDIWVHFFADAGPVELLAVLLDDDEEAPRAGTGSDEFVVTA
jgi:hypothetical protein